MSFRCEVIVKEPNCDWFPFKHCTILIRVDLAHAMWSQHNGAALYWRGSTLCIVQFWICFPLPSEWEPPIFWAVVTPLEAGPCWRALPPWRALGTQPEGLTTCAWEASFLPSLWPLACVGLTQPGTRSCPSCRLSDLRVQLRMQADKCRTSSRNVKKELVIESPLQRKDAVQGEVEAESPVPVLVRGAHPQRFCCFPHAGLCSCVSG